MFSHFLAGSKGEAAAALSIQILRANFAQKCARLHAPAFAHSWGVADFEAILTANANVAEGAVLAKTQALAAFVVASLVADEAEILTLVVDPAWRRHGLGRKLLTTHMGRLAGMGAKKLFLEVASLNVPALGLYRALGFQQAGARPAYYRKADGSKDEALILRRDLS